MRKDHMTKLTPEHPLYEHGMRMITEAINNRDFPGARPIRSCGTWENSFIVMADRFCLWYDDDNGSTHMVVRYLNADGRVKHAAN